MTRPLAALLAAACLALLIGCGGGGGGKPAADSVNVAIAGFKFTPKTVEVRKDGTVTWTNRDKAPHTAEAVRGAPAPFDTGRLDRGESRTIRVDRPGTYSYFCRLHRFMSATVKVVE